MFSIVGIVPIPVYAAAQFTPGIMEFVPLSAPLGWNEGALWDAWGSSASDVYVVGGYDSDSTSLPLVYHSDGITWSEVGLSLPSGWTGSSLYSVWGSGADDIYAVG
ncbi:MAG TPA: hypothetical protein VKP08_02760, partial [Anaerolineales bacterium]|nr:hypothetical protein [Anaerolineales bacterium]